MITSRRRRRRAERFAQLLDEASGGRRQHRRTPLDEELTALVTLRQQLAATGPGPGADPEFRTGLRAMLIATAEREGIGQAARPTPAAPAPRPGGALAQPARPVRAGRTVRGPRARTAVVAGMAIGAVAFTGMSTASESAVPGDPLYGVKRSSERAQLALASSDVGRGQLYLDFAETRLAEARRLAGDLERVFDDMDRDTSQGVRLLTAAATNRQDRAALDAVDAFAAGQRSALEELSGAVSGADRTRLVSSLELLDAIELRTAELRQSLRECAGPSATSIDSLGPVPTGCVGLPGTGPFGLPPDPWLGQVRPPDEPPRAGDRPRPAGAVEFRPGRPAGSAGPPATGGPADETARSSPEPEPDPDEDVPDEADGGLLSGLNRLLGSLLGG